MALLDQLMETMLGSSSVKSLSNISGADSTQVQQVLTEALPTLVQGMQKNASTKSGEAALSTALSDHAKADTSDVGTFLNNVDLEDGDKIVSHILGSDKANVKYGISQKSGIDVSQIGTILAAAAPLLMSLLGSKKNENQSEGNSGGGLGDILGSLLGGNNNSSSSNNGGGLGDILGSLLGGNDNNSSNNNSGGIGDILGSLLGGNDNNSNNGSNDTGEVIGDLIGSLLGGKTKKSSTKKTGAKRATKKRK